MKGACGRSVSAARAAGQPASDASIRFAFTATWFRLAPVTKSTFGAGPASRRLVTTAVQSKFPSYAHCGRPATF